MARSVLPPSTNPPDDSQSERDETESDEGESDQMVRNASEVRGMDSGSDADSGSSFPSPTASAFVLKQNPNSKKKKRLSAAAAAVEMYESEVKKKLKTNGIATIASEEDKIKKSSGRLWYPEDELLILEGMIYYKKETCVDPSSNWEAFHSYVKDSLNTIASKRQLSSKLRKLKEKYHANALKEANGELLQSLKGHEAKVYEFSKKIWGHNVIAGGSHTMETKPKNVDVVPCASVAETNSVLALPVPEGEVSSKVMKCGGTAKVSSQATKVPHKIDLDDADHEKKKLDDADHEKEDSIISMPVFLDSVLIEKGLEFVERSKLDALNEKWTEYQMDAAELYVRRTELVREQTRLILDAFKSNS